MRRSRFDHAPRQLVQASALRQSILAMLALWAAAAPGGLHAQGLSLALEEVASGLSRPVAIRHAGDGSGRLFIAEQAGRILVLKDGSVLPTPFLDISTLVEDTGNEQGLLGLAFHPDYWKPNDEGNGFFFVNYTEPEPNPPSDCPPAPATCDANSVVVRYRVSDADTDVADPASAQVLLRLNQPRRNHNGGNILFGPDGYLYVGFGDGGGGGDPYDNGQDLSTLHGSILRIDVDGSPPPEPNDLCGLDVAYGIPASNPLVGVSGACDEIWAYGLRNPWRWSFDRETGDLFIGDVGQATVEEIDFQSSSSSGGENYGWNCYEGSLPYPGGATCSGPVVFPIFEHLQESTLDPENTAQSITGGYRYRGALHPRLEGVYLYGDFVEGRIWGTVPRCDAVWESQLLLDNPFFLSTFGEDESGELYITEFDLGDPVSKIHRLGLAAASGGPTLEASPASIDFGSVQVRTSGSRELTLANTNGGSEAVLVSAMSLSDPTAFQIDASGGSNPCHSLTPCLAPGTSCTVSLLFSPSSAGQASETFEASGNTPPALAAVTAAGVPCNAEQPRVLDETTVTDTRTEEACGTLAAGPYEIADGGAATFRAGQAIELRNGFVVWTSGAFTVEIDPGLAP